MTKQRFTVLVAVTAAVGVYVGYQLAEIQNLQSYKLANIVGLLLNLLAILVLSEVLVLNPGWKKFCVEFVAPTLLWCTITVPVGMGVGVGIAWLAKRGHSVSAVGIFALAAYAYGSMLATILEAAVVLPRGLTVVLPRVFAKDIETRWRLFGLILLVTGMLLQLVSAISAL